MEDYPTLLTTSSENSLFNLKECPQESLCQTFTKGSYYGVDKRSLQNNCMRAGHEGLGGGGEEA